MEPIQGASQGPTGRTRRFAGAVEISACVAGIVCLAYAGTQYVEGAAGSRQAIESFARLQAALARQAAATDLTLWSKERIEAWRKTSELPEAAPLAVMRIPRIHLEVAVLEGTDDVTLNRAIGHVEGTAEPGDDGNSGLAGHRDGFFRGLKDVEPGDVIELDTLRGKAIYRIERTWIVRPEDVSVLDPTDLPSLTLITCYPFYVVGPAPKRFIVRAVRAAAPRDSRAAPGFPVLTPSGGPGRWLTTTVMERPS